MLINFETSFYQERGARETTESRHTQSHTELLQLRDKEKDIRLSRVY
jgi:hypothetical protein